MKNLTKLRNFVARPYHAVQAFAAANKYDYPASNMTVIGITGTNGKTTTCFMIYKMLRNAGKNVALMSTVANGFNDDITPQNAHMTTAGTKLLNKRIAEFREKGAEFLVLEVTSHALAQHRIFGVPIDIAVMTNVTHEHLDYHGTFANYLNTKRKLFKLARKNSKHGGRGIGIINADDPSAKYFLSDVEKSLTYGKNSGDLRARQVKLTPRGVEYFVKFSSAEFRENPEKNLRKNQKSAQKSEKSSEKYHIRTKIPGEFNVANSLATLAVGIALGLNKKQIEEGIFALDSVEGRMNAIDEGQDFSVIVDFAHTPDAFAKLFPDLKKSTKNRLIAVFGSAGKRDEMKRAAQGEIAGKFADIVVVTEEDARGPIRPISEQIAQGAEKSGKVREKNLFLIDDREAAIKFALQIAKTGDTVVFLGKGHEKTMERDGKIDPYDEIKLVKKYLRKNQKSGGK